MNETRCTAAVGEQGVNIIFSNGFTLSSNFNDNSYFMLVHTNVTTYTVAQADVLTITHGATGTPVEHLSNPFTVYAPVPEPEDYAMLLAGAGLLGLARRRAAEKPASLRSASGRAVLAPPWVAIDVSVFDDTFHPHPQPLYPFGAPRSLRERGARQRG